MKSSVALLICLLIFTAGAAADSGIKLIIKGGIVDGLSYPGLNLPNENMNRQKLAGGQFYISRTGNIDMILGIDYFNQSQQYEIEGRDFNLSMNDFSATMSFVYSKQVSLFDIFFGGGCGSHSLSFEYLRPRELSLENNGVTIPEIATYFGFHAMAGFMIAFPSMPVGLFVESKINRINLPDRNIKYNSIAGGIYLNLP